MEKLELLSLSRISVSKLYIENNETYSIRMVLQNRSDIDIYNLVIKNCIPENCKYDEGIVRINGKETSCHPAIGINIVKLVKGEEAEIYYNLKANLPNGGVINNIFKIKYEYYNFTKCAYIELDKEIDMPKIIVNVANFQNEFIQFSMYPKNIDIGEQGKVTINLKNTGNVSSNSTSLILELPENLKRVSDKIVINGRPIEIKSGIRKINIGKLDSYDEVNIQLDVVAIERTSEGAEYIRGTVAYETFITPGERRCNKILLKDIKVKIESPKLLINMEVSDYKPIINDEVEVIYKIKNIGNKIALGSKIFISIGDNLEIINKGEINDNILNGITLGDIDILKEVEIKVYMKCIKIGESGNSRICGRINYTFEVETDSNDNLRYYEEELKNIQLEILRAECNISLTCNKSKAILDDIITYKGIVKNIGSLEALNVFINIVLPNEVEFIRDSFIVNSRIITIPNIANKICIGNLQENKEVTIEFKGRVIEVNKCRILKVKVQGKFQYRGKNFLIREKLMNDIIIESLIEEAMFKSIVVDGTVKLGSSLPKVKEILEVVSSVCLTNYYPVKSSNIESIDNKLIVNGYIESKIEYISDSTEETIYIAPNKTTFSTFIILPKNYSNENKLLLEGEVTDGYTRLIGNKTIYLLNNLNLQGRLLR